MLSDAACRNAKPSEKQRKLTDGKGLYLLVLPSGGKSWRYAYRFDGKQKALALGQYPAVSLVAARGKRDDARKLLDAGIDPSAEAKSDTFESFARRWHDTNKGQWVPAHAERVLSRIERDVFPTLGQRPITQIEAPDVLDVLRKVEERGALDISKRLRQSIGAVFRFAIAEGKAKSNPAADVGDALKPKPKVRHMAAVKLDEVHDLVRKIAAYDGEPITRIALQFVFHTFVRTNELRLGVWSEIEGDIWRIPKERMKMGREHVVPLTPQTLALLEEAKQYESGPYIFPGLRGKPLSQNTLIFGLYRLGFHSRQTVHGLRRLASTTLNEHGWPSDHIEMQLAHVSKDRIRGIYNSAEWLEGRKKMMTWWSDYLSEVIQSTMVDSRQRTDCPPMPTGLGNSPSAILR